MSLRPASRLAMTALLALWPALGQAASDPSELKRNKAIAMRVFSEIFNQKRFAVADQIYAPDFVNHGIRRDVSLQEDLAAARAEVTAFPDCVMTVEMLVAEDDLVTALWTFRGTHTAFGYGLPPTGTRVTLRGITIWRIRDGRIHDEWTTFNVLSAYMQLLAHLRWFIVWIFLLLGGAVWVLVRRQRAKGAANASH